MGLVGGRGQVRLELHSKYIYGQSTSVSTSCADYADYDIEVSISGDDIVFSDSRCDDLRLSDSLVSSGPLYVYVGADCDGCTAEWYSLETY